METFVDYFGATFGVLCGIIAAGGVLAALCLGGVFLFQWAVIRRELKNKNSTKEGKLDFYVEK